MSTVHSPRRTRSQAQIVEQSGLQAAEVEQQLARAEESDLLRDTLQAAVEELRMLRQERWRVPLQGQGEPGEQLGVNSGQSFPNYKLRADNYDGKTPFREFLSQFDLVARASGWGDREKAIILAANLRGKARSVLENLEGEFSYNEIKAKLELRFGEHFCFQNYYTQFTNRRMKFGEEFASFGSDFKI